MQNGVASAPATAPSPGRVDPVRVMAVDPHDLFRAGLCRLLEDQGGLSIVADARTGETALEHVALARPDVVLMDIELPGMSGIATAAALIERAPATAVVILTDSEDEDDVLEAVLAGASSYLLKDTPLPEIASAIRASAQGDSVISPRMASSLLTRVRGYGRPAARPSAAHLSERELDVLRLLVAGCNNMQIADSLHRSPSTIKHHVASVVEKLGVENRVQAAVRTVRLHLV